MVRASQRKRFPSRNFDEDDGTSAPRVRSNERPSIFHHVLVVGYNYCLFCDYSKVSGDHAKKSHTFFDLVIFLRPKRELLRSFSGWVSALGNEIIVWGIRFIFEHILRPLLYLHCRKTPKSRQYGIPLKDHVHTLQLHGAFQLPTLFNGFL